MVAPAGKAHRCDGSRWVLSTAEGDHDRAHAVLETAQPDALQLGMRPWSRCVDEARSALAPARGPLAPRELEVAELVAKGLTNRAIAERLFLSERTAQNHVQHILTKLGVSNRSQITAWYLAR